MSGRDRHDVIVIGVGGIGSATIAHLASRGVDVLGIERFDVPHARGSSHGRTRIIRRVQHEDDAYVPLVDRSYELWRDLESTTGRDLLHGTGSVHAGAPGTDIVDDARRACETHGIEYEHLGGPAVNERFPGYDLPAGYGAVYQPDGGFLACEECVIAHVEAGHSAGATVRARERVLDWSETTDGVSVRTGKGRYEADELVLTPGPWTADLVEGLSEAAVPVRAVMAWFRPERPAHFAPDRFPVFVVRDRESGGYGFPVHDVPGFKLGLGPDRERPVDPDEVDREPTTAEEDAHRRFAERYFPAGAGPTLRLRTCIVTYSPDDHFVLGRLPGHDAVTVGAAFSGHGFKFASVLGEVLADLATRGETDLDVGLFDTARL